MQFSESDFFVSLQPQDQRLVHDGGHGVAVDDTEEFLDYREVCVSFGNVDVFFLLRHPFLSDLTTQRFGAEVWRDFAFNEQFAQDSCGRFKRRMRSEQVTVPELNVPHVGLLVLVGAIHATGRLQQARQAAPLANARAE